jgi:UDP-N-acetylglucosamine diphosphorylase / glucose-1-phosphate thymidylyltransferase / UDP-N-acetylgalactosamine diphosphorylase / glucosamine-1-phosphate N-acetyltransferase / galactosamine-1-phosphate N-acetyltransferase
VRWVLFDDAEWDRLRPFTWLRPASAMLLGTETLEARWRRLVAPDELVVACRRPLAAVGRGRVALEEAAGAAAGGDIWVSDLLVPDPVLVRAARGLGERGAVMIGGRPAEGPGPETARVVDLGGDRLLGLADLVCRQESLLAGDLERILAATPPPIDAGDGHAYDLGRVRLGAGCTIDHGAVLDAREGPVVLGSRCHVFPHTWICGPFFASDDCLLLGGRIGGGTSLGPVCRVRGEVEASVFLGLSNKAHDGFIGHSYLGEWVNLGAMTTTSDLKNNYSPVGLERDGVRERTTQRKLGAFLGDHVKTRIGCLLTCGTIAGVGANLVGDPAVPARWVPDFTWGVGPGAVEYEIEEFLRTAEIVHGRRGVSWRPEEERVLRGVHTATAAARAAAGVVRRKVTGGRSGAVGQEDA